MLWIGKFSQTPRREERFGASRWLLVSISTVEQRTSPNREPEQQQQQAVFENLIGRNLTL